MIRYNFAMNQIKNKQVVTRFAPSPTGLLHIGGARTALFAWVFARQQQGQFILRMEDTDQKRSSDQSMKAILTDLQWLGIDWDQGPNAQSDDPANDQIGEHGPYFQSQRLDIYQKYIDQLIKANKAYDDQGAVRFRQDADVAFDDQVYGHIQVKAADLEDFIIRKSDGFPTFHLAVVVDDALMGVNHVIRGQEHLSNTPKHIALQKALGFEVPTYVHIPSIMNPGGSKMSKRDKAKAARKEAKAQNLSANALESQGITAEQLQAFLDKKSDDNDIANAIAKQLDLTLPEINVEDFRQSGYLTSALINYISLLGWNPGNDVERFSLDFLIEKFSFKRIGKSNATFDRDKLFRFNAEQIAELPEPVFGLMLQNHFAKTAPHFLTKLNDQQFKLFAKNYQPRARTLSEPALLGTFFISDDQAIEFVPKAVKKNLLKNDRQGIEQLRDFVNELEKLANWDAQTLEQLVKNYAEQKEIGMGQIAQPLRIALTGNTISPAIGDTLSLLGKDSVLARIRRCINVHKIQSV